MNDAEWVGKESPGTKRLEEENERLSKLLGLVSSYNAAAGRPPKWMAKRGKGAANRATAVGLFSDWHLDEVVEPSQVGGLNAYNREIALLRLKRWADKTCELGTLHSHEWDGFLLLANGDLCSGAIHEELRETNEDYLPSTMVFWAPKIAAAWGQVLDHYGKMHVTGIVGNHGRLTGKPQFKGRARNSWDWLLYHMVRSHFKNDARVTWEIAEGSYLFVPIYDRFTFQTHGDEVKGGGGWAGVWSPLGTIHRRSIELGAAHGIRPAYCSIGHWHQTILAHHRGLVNNGSGKGWDEFAAGLRLVPEAAMQNWWVETPDRGTAMAAALYLEDRKKEGW